MVVFLLIVSLTLLAALALVSGVGAQEGTDTGTEVTDDQVNEVASRLYCPICENTPLDVCPTQACKDWRAEIKSLLEQGYTEEEVRTYFVDRYGVRVLGEPPKQGFTSLVWVLPYVGLGVGLLILGVVLLRMSRATASPQTAQVMGDAPPADGGEEDAAYRSRLEQELEDFST